MLRRNNLLANIDWTIVLLFLALLFLGWINIYASVYNEEYQSVNELSKNVAWSSRQINRYFSKQYGFPLKTFLNIVRCNASYNDIVNGEFFPSKKYSDQSHFIKEIKKYTENTPRQLHKNENDRFLQLSTFKTK